MIGSHVLKKKVGTCLFYIPFTDFGGHLPKLGSSLCF